MVVSSAAMELPDRDIWLPTVLGRVCVFLFVFALLDLSLFLVGNFQSFLDSTQVLLLRLFEIASMLFVVVAPFFSITAAIVAIRKRSPAKILSMVLSLCAAGALLGLHWIFNFLLVWLKPVN